MAELLSAGPRVAILNDVVLNQVLVRFEADGEDPDGSGGDARTRAVIEAVQRDGTCWLGGTVWGGRAAMRVSVSGWQTSAADIDRSADAILACLAASTTSADSDPGMVRPRPSGERSGPVGSFAERADGRLGVRPPFPVSR
jgi:hypothetical protein